jgi:uncharacterized membrane protein YGL010W
MALVKQLKFEEQFAFYGAYHSEWRNQLIHIIFVPAIVWTIFVWMACMPDFTNTNGLEKGQTFRKDWGLLMCLALSGYYISLEPVSGVPCTLALFALHISANMFVGLENKKHGPKSVASMPRGTAWKIAMLLHVVSWVAQIKLGHEQFEGRKPALLDNFFQAIVMAPFFVWNEILWGLGFNLEIKEVVEPLLQAAKAHLEHS